MTKIKDIIEYLDSVAPGAYQESYDNAGLITGNPHNNVQGVLITLDSTEEVIEEAKKKNCNLVIAHHPIIFSSIKSLTGKNYVERTILKAIKEDISIYAIHTNLDNVKNGVNNKICDKLELVNRCILSPKSGNQSKIVTFIPKGDTDKVMESIHAAGAGIIGKYENCSFRVEGTGTFKPGEGADPHIGERNKLEKVEEIRVEFIFPSHLKSKIIKAMNDAHPYEEVAYYLSGLDNQNHEVGAGMIGELENQMDPSGFMTYLKKQMNLECIRHTPLVKDQIKKVAVCGGSGSFLLKEAIRQDADIFISADFKYHQFFDADNKIIIADIGHYESEVFTKDLIYELLHKKFSNFALDLSEVVTNPIKYFKN